jgi:GTP:adenosylcobinamide-phosphate guanylyltransferase
MSHSRKPFTAVILAGDRASGDPVAQAAGVASKSLVPVGGTAMVVRVLEALEGAQEVGTCILCGPTRSAVDGDEGLRARVESGRVRWVESQATPSASAFHTLQSRPDGDPVLVTTADHALLNARMVDYFCSEARATGCDVVAAVARYDLVASAYPGTRRTVTRLRDGGYCGCNLFAFLTRESRAAADFWRRVETQRKKPLRVIRAVGWMAVIRYALGRLTLAEGLERISKRMNLKVCAVPMPFPEAAVDVDSVDDWTLVESIVADRDSSL